MKFSNTNVGASVEILAVNEHKSVPVTVAEPDDAETNGYVVKAGTPLTSEGKSTTASGAVGILLYDVDTSENPNGALLVIGIIDAKKAQEHSGVTYDVEGLTTALNAAGCTINLRTDIGVNE